MATSRAAGFTLVELTVVIAIIALAGQLVFLNLGQLIPSTALNSKAKELSSMIQFLRSESQLQGKPYSLELDLDEDRYRTVLPIEEAIVSTNTIEDEVGNSWTYLDEPVVFHSLITRDAFDQRNGRAMLTFDENGFSSDVLLVLTHQEDAYSDLLWTIEIRGLDRSAKIIKSEEGDIPRLELTEELSFR